MIAYLIGALIGAVIAVGVYIVVQRLVLNGQKNEIIAKAEIEAEGIKNDKIHQAKEKFLQLKSEHEQYINEKNSQLRESESRIKQRENTLNQQNSELQRKLREADNTRNSLQNQQDALAKKAEELAEQYPYTLKLAVMGCAVNGPGEAREADLGIAGGDGEGLIFKKGEIVRKVREDELFDALKNELDNWSL